MATLFLAAVIRLSRVPLSFMLRGLRAVAVLLLISISFNMFLTPGEVIFQAGFLKLTKEGLRMAAFMGIRLVYLVVGSSVMTLTTTPNQLTDGMEKGLGFLKVFRVPVHEIAMMMSIALRFIPILIEETDLTSEGLLEEIERLAKDRSLVEEMEKAGILSAPEINGTRKIINEEN